MYIGHLPGEGANAYRVGVTFPVIMAISAFAALVSMGGAPRASTCWARAGRTKQKNIPTVPSALITVAVVLTAFFLIFGRRILLMFGASGTFI